MRTIRIQRSGFTLTEILVVLAIMAALAAIILPAVASQTIKAEVSRVTGDLTNIRTATEAFIVDVHRYPGDIEDLVAPIGGGDLDINGNAYAAGLQAKWTGPYVDRVMPDGDSLETGFGGYVLDNFVNDTITGVGHLTALIVGIDSVDFVRVDEAIDEGNGPTSGRLHWTAGPPDTLRFFALPIN